MFKSFKLNSNSTKISRLLGQVRARFDAIQSPFGICISVNYANIPMPVRTLAIKAIRAKTGFLDFHRK